MTELHKMVVHNESWISIVGDDWFGFDFSKNDQTSELKIEIDFRNPELETVAQIANRLRLTDRVTSLQQLLEFMESHSPFPQAKFIVLKVRLTNLNHRDQFSFAMRIVSALHNIACQKIGGSQRWKIIFNSINE